MKSSHSLPVRRQLHPLTTTESSSGVFRIVLLELLNNLVVVLLDPSDISADAVHCLLYIIVGVEDAVLEAETCGVTITREALIEFPKEFLFLCLLANEDLLIVRCGITQVLGLIAILRGCLKVKTCMKLKIIFFQYLINLQLLKGVGEADVEIINPLLRDVSG